MLGRSLYNNCVYRMGFVLGSVIFALGYAYLAGIALQVYLSGGTQVALNPVWVWHNLLNYWNNWSVYKDKMQLKMWFSLFGALITPFALSIIAEKVIYWTLYILFWPIRAYKRRQAAKQPHVMTTEEHIESLETQVAELKQEMDELQQGKAEESAPLENTTQQHN